MHQLIEEYKSARTPNRAFICDDESDLNNIENPEFGMRAYVIHSKKKWMTDSSGRWYEMGTSSSGGGSGGGDETYNVATTDEVNELLDSIFE